MDMGEPFRGTGWENPSACEVNPTEEKRAATRIYNRMQTDNPAVANFCSALGASAGVVAPRCKLVAAELQVVVDVGDFVVKHIELS